MSIIPKKLAKYMIPKIGLGENNWQAIDVSVEEFGSLFVILPISDAGKAWLNERVSLKMEVSPSVNGVIVEAGLVDNLIDGLERAGLNVSGSEQGQPCDWRSLIREISKN